MIGAPILHKKGAEMSQQSRREFLEQSMFAAAAAAIGGRSTRAAAATPNQPKSSSEQLKVACIGVNGRGGSHLKHFGERLDCRVGVIVDVDEAVGRRNIQAFEKQYGYAPQYERDLRKMLEDKTIDIVSIATPNHWHALAAIWAIQAGKDVYVEKPVSHNVSEGRRIVQAARKHGRIVQTGTQSRSAPGMRAAIEYMRSGKIGDVQLARGLCYKLRPSIGPKGTYEVPKTVDYNLWLGPAPQRPSPRRRFHYDWHWFWDYGNGDLGNQGIHQMDICRWGLGENDIGTSVISYGGRLGYEDAGETANTQVSIHGYPDGKRLVFEVRGLSTPKLRGAGVGNIFYGTQGSVVMPGGGGGAAFDPKGNTVATFSGEGDPHWENFINAVRSRKHEDLHADILEGHRSSALCHLGNISYRLGDLVTGKEASERLASDKETAETFERFREHLAAHQVMIENAPVVRFGTKLTVDPQNEVFTGGSMTNANALLTREYRAPFVVPSERDV